MNKKYIVPEIWVVSFTSEGFVAASIEKIGFSSDVASHGDSSEEVLSNSKGDSYWDED